MNYNFYHLKTISNTHVGSGQSSYGIVDNIVQKDYLTSFPCMNSTSLKGAMREWIDKGLGKKSEAIAIFGSSNEKDDNSKTNQAGSHHFFQASLLSFPMRSNKVGFFNVTCPAIISELSIYLESFGITQYKTELAALLNIVIQENSPISFRQMIGAIIEKHTIKTIASPANIAYSNNLKQLFGDNLVIMHNDTFSEIIKKLPIITRNNLENGQSTNLFYEEVVPRETHFGFLVGYKESASALFSAQISNKSAVQIGANATVGYGFCELSKLI